MAENNDGSGLSVDLADAGRQLEAFANGPAKAAGEALQAAFAKAGSAIRGELSSLAKSGETDLDRLGRSIVDTLAKLAVSQIAGSGSAGEAKAPVNVTMNFSGGASGNEAVGSSNQIAAAVARAVQRGARFS